MAADLEPSPSRRLPGRYAALAIALAARRRVFAEWTGSPPHRLVLAGSRPEGLGVAPRDLRPADAENGGRILAGAFVLAGTTLAFGPKGDPWDRPSPSRRFAVALHRFGWMKDLLAADPAAGAAEGLRLTLEWRRLFGAWNAFAWSGEVLERRVFNLACTLRTLCVRASEAEAATLTLDLARQARCLLGLREGPARAAERAAVAAVAGAALLGQAGDRLLARALRKLETALGDTVDDEGGHRSRSPQAALDLLLDLLTLDDALAQRGQAPPEAVVRAIDRLSATVRFFTLGDGRLAAFQGGDEMTAAYVAAAQAQDDLAERILPPSRGGYHRLEARSLQIMADGGAPARGPWSVAACAQPLAMEVLAAGRRLIVGAGWSPDAQGPQAVRLVDAASTAGLGETSCGEPLRGFPARILGPRLIGAEIEVRARRHEAPAALWLEMSHDGWERRFGLRHERRLYLDVDADELRGEDGFSVVGTPGPEGRRFVHYTVRFHLHPEVSALIARDHRSVLLKPEGQDHGWWMRTDALDVVLEPSVHYQEGQARRSQQIVLRGQVRLDTGAKVRWKLSSAEPRTRVDEAPQPA